MKASELAYRSALLELGNNQAPCGAPFVDHGLANVLTLIGSYEQDTERLNEAIEVFHRVLDLRSPNNDLSGWLSAKIDLGCALTCLASYETGKGSL